MSQRLQKEIINQVYQSSQLFMFSQYFFAFVIFLLYEELQIGFSQLSINSVSLSPTTYIGAAGSLAGGTPIYINGSGFSPVPSQNTVLAGPYACDIEPNGSQPNMIVCKVSQLTNFNARYGLSVRVTVGNNSVLCSTSNCMFGFLFGKTPQLHEVIWSSISPGSNLYLFGIPRISSVSQIIKVTIGNYLCDHTAMAQNIGGRGPIICKVDSLIIAGEYNLTLNLTIGFTVHSHRIYKTSFFTNAHYSQRIIAQINTLSSHICGLKGHRIQLSGVGFSSNISDYSCSVAGQICQVLSANLTSLEVEVPPLLASNTDFGKLIQDPSDSTVQQSPYLMGNGALYRRYTSGGLSKTDEDWLTYLRGAPTLTLQSEKIITELSSPEIYGSWYVQYVRGYFYAPIDGQYKFSCVCDDICYMKLSNVRNNSNPANLQPLISLNVSSQHHFNPFVQVNATQPNSTINLIKGHYYFQFYNLENTGNSGYFKIMVDIPTLRPQTRNIAWQMDRISIKPSSFDAQIIVIQVFAASGSFSIYYYEVNNVLRNMTVPVGASASSFKSLLASLRNINNCSFTVSMTTLDAAGSPSTTSIEGYEYRIQITDLRPNTTLPYVSGNSLVQGNVPKSITINTVSTRSPLMSGTYRILNGGTAMLYNGNPHIAFNAVVEDIVFWYFYTYYRNFQINVIKTSSSKTGQCIQYTVEYVGIFGPAGPLALDITNLNAGKAGAYIQATVETIRQYSGRELYSPLPYDFLHVAAQAPTLQISVKFIPALCSDCSFQYMPALTPLVTAAERSGNKYTISLSDPGLINFTLSDVTVTMFNVSCSGLTGTISNFSCYLPINADGSAAIPAGSGLPSILVSQIGCSDSSALPNETIPLIVTNILSGQSSLIGGDETTMTGSGFPISSAIGLSILVCGNQVTNFTLISNQILKFIIPPETVLCNGSNNIISYNGESTSFSFYYNPCLLPGDSVRCGNMYNTSDLSRDSFLRLWSNASQWPNQLLPQDGQDVMIPYEWNLILDIDPPILNFVEIYGVLNFDRGRDNLFRAHYIWVRQGGIIRIGSEELPFANRAQTILYGNQNDVRLAVDSKQQGNKIMVVTGGLQFYGYSIQSSRTTLSASASVGDNQISVGSSAGWKVGDQIVITPSYANPNQFQQVSITSINGKLIGFDPPLLYEHFGAANTTINNQYGVLDARSAVGVLNRNIKISADISNNDWGCRVLIYGFFDSIENMWKSGYAKMKGVEFMNCGQYNSTEAGMKIHNIGNDNNGIVTKIENSVFRNCLGMCLFMKESSNLQISNNLFFNGLKYLIFVEDIQSQFNFTGNLLIGVFKSDKFANFGNNNDDQVAAYKQVDSTSSLSGMTINVKHNLVQGSEGGGFVLPMTDCSQISLHPFANNTVGSCYIGFVFESLGNLEGDCVAAKGGSAYASEFGLMAKIMGPQTIQISGMVLADNAKAINFNILDQESRNKLIFTDSYVAGVSRLNCPNCYSQHKLKYCQQASGLFISSASSSIASINVTVSSEVETDNVLFENFFFLNSNFSYCSRMSIFGRPSANSSIASSFFLRNTSTRNCENQSWVNFQLTSVETQQCQAESCFGGNNNCFIFDQDGAFTGSVSQILGNHSEIGDSESVCHNIEFANSHWCDTDRFAILEFQSNLWDPSEGDIWPVYIIRQDGQWNSTANVLGSETLETKYQIAGFRDITKLNQTISIFYSSPKNYQSMYKLQRTSLSQNKKNWLVILLSCIPGASYIVTISNTSHQNHHIQPIMEIGGEAVNLANFSFSCGANLYNASTNQISVFIAEDGCVVNIKFSSALKLILFLDIFLQDFRSENISDLVKSVLANYLQIDESRISVINAEERSPQIHNQTKIEILFSLNTDYNAMASSKVGIIQLERNEMEKMQIRLQQGLAQGIIERMLLPYFISFSFVNFIEQDENSEEELQRNDIEVFVILGLFFLALSSFAVAAKNKGPKNSDIKINGCKKTQNKVGLNVALKQCKRISKLVREPKIKGDSNNLFVFEASQSKLSNS